MSVNHKQTFTITVPQDAIDAKGNEFPWNGRARLRARAFDEAIQDFHRHVRHGDIELPGDYTANNGTKIEWDAVETKRVFTAPQAIGAVVTRTAAFPAHNRGAYFVRVRPDEVGSWAVLRADGTPFFEGRPHYYSDAQIEERLNAGLAVVTRA